jgi:hypothetical protein
MKGQTMGVSFKIRKMSASFTWNGRSALNFSPALRDQAPRETSRDTTRRLCLPVLNGKKLGAGKKRMWDFRLRTFKREPHGLARLMVLSER